MDTTQNNERIIEMNAEKADFDFWSDRLGIQYGCYNGEIDEHIFNVAKLIVGARKIGTGIYNTDIAEELGLPPAYIELIQYILAGVRYPVAEREAWWKGHPFDYGSSPRGLFVGNEKAANKFIEEYSDYFEREWSSD